MGGCRCSYRNCTVRSDGKSHMFHYPVFDKLRCHQWLQNAQRLDFLNLKVSQLKNRVICEHHFTDDKFMNPTKFKLKPDAVPTEDGPYCDSSKWTASKLHQEYNISLQDIESELSSITRHEKLANFSVKYGDFLINCDIMDLMSMNQKNYNSKIDLKPPIIDLNQNNTNDFKINDDTTLPRPLLSVEPYKKIIPIKEPKVLPIEFNELQISSHGNVHVKNSVNTTNANLLNQYPKETNDKSKLKKISIISEQKITHPIPKVGKLQPISPSFVLPLKKKDTHTQNSFISEMKEEHVNPFTTEMRKENEINPSIAQTRNENQLNLLVETRKEILQNPFMSEMMYENVIKTPANEIMEENVNTSIQERNEKLLNTSVVQTKEAEESASLITLEDLKIEPLSTSVATKPESISTRNTEVSVVSDNLINKLQRPATNNSKSILTVETSPKVTVLRNRIPPERVAAIEKKRKFNMKLRDIIESCLDKLDEQDNQAEVSKNTADQTKQAVTQNVSTFLAKDPKLPSLQEFNMSYIENRMKKMENNLLKKIEQNSERIVDLKNSLVKAPVKTKSTSTQMSTNDDSYKKQLYAEISQYLSAEANSLIYEELFINKFGHNAPKSSSPKPKRSKYR